MAARCFGFSIVLLGCLARGLCQFVGLGSPTVLVRVTALASLYNAKRESSRGIRLYSPAIDQSGDRLLSRGQRLFHSSVIACSHALTSLSACCFAAAMHLRRRREAL